MSKDIVNAINSLKRCLKKSTDTTELENAIAETNTLLQELIDITNEQKDYEIICISDGNETVKGVLQVDSEGNEVILLDGNDVTGTYSQVSCEKTAYDYESKTVCVDGKNWTKTLVYESENDGDPNYVTTIWLDEIDVIQSAPDQTLIDNENCDECAGEILGVVNDWIPSLQLNPGGESSPSNFNSLNLTIHSPVAVYNSSQTVAVNGPITLVFEATEGFNLSLFDEYDTDVQVTLVNDKLMYAVINNPDGLDPLSYRNVRYCVSPDPNNLQPSGSVTTTLYHDSFKSNNRPVFQDIYTYNQ